MEKNNKNKDDQGVTCLIPWMQFVALTILIILLVTLQATYRKRKNPNKQPCHTKESKEQPNKYGKVGRHQYINRPTIYNIFL